MSHEPSTELAGANDNPAQPAAPFRRDFPEESEASIGTTSHQPAVFSEVGEPSVTLAERERQLAQNDGGGYFAAEAAIAAVVPPSGIATTEIGQLQQTEGEDIEEGGETNDGVSEGGPGEHMDREGDDDDENGGGGGKGSEDVDGTPIKMLIHPRNRPKREGPRTKEQRLAAQGGKAGNPGKFKDEAFEFLLDLVDDYRLIDRTTGAAKKQAGLKAFWHRTTAAFWDTFSWRQFEEPEHNGEQAAVEADVLQSMKSWFRYRASLANTGSNNPWAKLISELRKPAAGPPKKQAAWQLWAKRNKALIEAETDDPRRIGERNKTASRLFRELPLSERAEMEALAQSMYDEAMKKYSQAEEGTPSVNPEDQRIARERLPVVMKPLLELISQYTGYTCVTLIGGLPDDGKYRIGTVHYGETGDIIPKNLASFDQTAFRKDFVGYFTRFLRATKSQDPANEESADPDPEVEVDPHPIHRVPPHLPAPSLRRDATAHTHSNATVSATTRPTPIVSSIVAPATDPDVLVDPLDAQHIDSPAHATENEDEEQAGDSLDLPDGMNDALVRAVDALSGAEKLAVIRRLRCLEPFDLERECTMAKNAELLEKLGLGTGAHKILGMPAQSTTGQRPRSRPRPRPHATPASRPQTRSQAINEQISSRSSSPLPASEPSHLPRSAGSSSAQPISSTAEEPGSVAQHPASSPPPELLDIPRSSSPAPDVPISQPADLSDCPEWWRTQYGVLVAEESIPSDLREEWTATLAEWITFERAMEFQSPRAGLSATSRPADISLWIQNARRGRIVLKQPGKYADQWWKWWDGLNPRWRQRVDGRPVAGGSGTWETLLKSGSNRWVNVLMGLVGLREVEDDAGWRAAFTDVRWVLRQVTLSKRSRKRPAPDTDDDDDDGSGMPEGAPKRARR